MTSSSLDRYRKQVLFAGIGEDGQRALARSRILVVGCGALGSVLAETVVRAGVGFVRLVDRDFVELSNLQRQVLYDEEDVRAQLPKSVAATRKLSRINSEVSIEPVVADVDHTNILGLTEEVDLILDGTDNFEVRFLINDAALETGIPWVNGGCVGSHGQVMAIAPGKTPCLRCLMDGVPDPASMETCDTAGVIAPAIQVVASLQVVEGFKILTGRPVDPVLTIVDVWDGSFRRLQLGDLADRTNCPACRQGERRWLRGESVSRSTVLCGRNAVQVTPATRLDLSLDDLAARLSLSGRVTRNPFLVRVDLPEAGCEITVFRDGRAIVKGTEELATARTIYARYVGT